MKATELFLLAFEGIQVVASGLDIVLDVLVCIEFYQKQLWIPFYASLGVFLIAQAAYAFLFAATYARNVTTVRDKLRAFLIALPLAQLVPIFSWLESFHWRRVDELLNRLDLTPTTTTIVEDGDAKISSTPALGVEEDNAMWSFARRKFKANIGFLVEAIVEAIPQAMIQTCVVVMYSEADALIVVSILMSVFVVASKGYMLSYSIHARTFLFNALCVVADVCGLFATIVWAFAACSSDSLLSPDPHVLYQAWLYLAPVACGLLGIGDVFLAMYANFDDHLKTLMYARQRWRFQVRLSTNNLFFDLWVVRTVIWALALLPISVLLLAMKVSALPLFFFKSVQPSHFTFPHVNRRLFNFVSRGGPQRVPERLKELNSLLRFAVIEADKAPNHAWHLYTQAAIVGSAQSKMNLRDYIRRMGKVVFLYEWRKDSALEPSPAPAAENDPAADRAMVRKQNRTKAIEREMDELERRSIIWWLIRGAYRDSSWPAVDKEESDSESDDESTDSQSEGMDGQIGPETTTTKLKKSKPMCGRRWHEWSAFTPKEKLLAMGGAISMLLCGVFATVLAPITVALACVGLWIPFYGPYQFFMSGPQLSQIPLEATLGLVLSGTYVACIFALVFLYPSVHAFQSTFKDVFDFSDHFVLGEDIFYKAGLDLILEEAYVRHRERLGKDLFRDYLETKANTDGAKRIMSFLTGTEAF